MSVLRDYSKADALAGLLEHEGFVRALARRWGRDESAADDLAQEAWLRVLDNPPRELRSPSAWLRNLVRRVAINEYLSEAARSEREQRARLHRRPRTPVEEMGDRSVRAQLSDALEQLAPAQREVILLRYYEDLPPREIAARLSIPVETVRTRTKRALARLREHLEVQPKGARRRATWGLSAPAFRRGGCVSSPSKSAVGAAVPLGIGGQAWLALAALALVLVCLAAMPREAPPSSVSAARAVDTGVADADRALAAVEPGERRPASWSPPPKTPVSPALAGTLELRCVRADAARAPVPGVTFDARLLSRSAPRSSVGPSGDAAPGPGTRASAQADASGEARLELAAGLWSITPDRGAPVRVSMEAGELQRLELPVRPGLDVHGHVRDASGRGIGGAEVYVTWPRRDDRIARTARTDARGAYRLDDVDRAAWIGASAERHRDGDLHFVGEPGRAGQAACRIDLRLAPETRAATGRVLDPSGRPVSGARIQPVLDLGGKLYRNPLYPPIAPAPVQSERVSDSEGRFSLADLPPYPWRLDVRAAGYAPLARTVVPRNVRARSAGGDWVELVLRHGSPIKGAEGAEAAPMTRPRIAGRVELPSGEPAGGLWVALREPSVRRTEDVFPNLPGRTACWQATTESGGFDFEDAGRGPYSLEVWSLAADGQALLAHFDPIHTTAGLRTLRLPRRRAQIEGVFFDGTAGADGTNGAALWIASRAGAPREVQVESGTGRFVLADLWADRYVLFSWRPGRSPRAAATVELGATDSVRLSPIVLEPAGSIRVRARTAAGEPAPALGFTLYEREEFERPGGRPVAFQRGTADEVSIEFDGVLPGRYVLTAGGATRARQSLEVEVRARECSEVELALDSFARGPIEVLLPPGDHAGSQLRLVLVDEQGCTRVRLLRPVLPAAATAETARVGLNVSVPPGTYTYRARLVDAPYSASGSLEVRGVGRQATLGVIELLRSDERP